MNPGLHVHEYLLTPSWQVPPFLHGSLLQSSMSATILHTFITDATSSWKYLRIKEIWIERTLVRPTAVQNTERILTCLAVGSSEARSAVASVGAYVIRTCGSVHTWVGSATLHNYNTNIHVVYTRVLVALSLFHLLHVETIIFSLREGNISRLQGRYADRQ